MRPHLDEIQMPRYAHLTTIPILPKNLEKYDIGWVDSASQRYYLADRVNKGIDVIDAALDKFITVIPGFANPNGVLVIPGRDQLWAGDGDATIKGANLKDNTIIAAISTGGTGRADELAHDEKDDIILAGCDKEDPPYAALVSTKDFTLLGKVMFPSGTEGLEQPVWNPFNNKFYLSVPGTPEHPGGEIAVIDPLEMKIVDEYFLTDTKPHGLAMTPQQTLCLCCSSGVMKGGAKARTHLMNARNGEIINTTFKVGGSDEVWYNPGDKRFYLAAGGMTSDGTGAGTKTPVIGVIDAINGEWITNIPLGAAGSHSVAVNPANNHIYSPQSGLGVAVYAEQH
jgi:DNA-binding beta-propeller fold protein YncE